MVEKKYISSYTRAVKRLLYLTSSVSNGNVTKIGFLLKHVLQYALFYLCMMTQYFFPFLYQHKLHAKLSREDEQQEKFHEEVRGRQGLQPIGKALNGRLYNTALDCILDASFVDYLEIIIPHSTIKFFPTLVSIITYQSLRLNIGDRPTSCLSIRLKSNLTSGHSIHSAHHIRRCFVQHLDAPYRTSLALSHNEFILSIAVVYLLITKRDILLD